MVVEEFIKLGEPPPLMISLKSKGSMASNSSPTRPILLAYSVPMAADLPTKRALRTRLISLLAPSPKASAPLAVLGQATIRCLKRCATPCGPTCLRPRHRPHPLQRRGRCKNWPPSQNGGNAGAPISHGLCRIQALGLIWLRPAPVMAVKCPMSATLRVECASGAGV